MGATKDMAMDEKMWSVTIPDALYTSLPQQMRESFASEKVFYRDEHRKYYDTDLHYRELYRTYRAAKKDMEDRLYDLRNGKV